MLYCLHPAFTPPHVSYHQLLKVSHGLWLLHNTTSPGAFDILLQMAGWTITFLPHPLHSEIFIDQFDQTENEMQI